MSHLTDQIVAREAKIVPSRWRLGYQDLYMMASSYVAVVKLVSHPIHPDSEKFNLIIRRLPGRS